MSLERSNELELERFLLLIGLFELFLVAAYSFTCFVLIAKKDRSIFLRVFEDCISLRKSINGKEFLASVFLVSVYLMYLGLFIEMFYSKLIGDSVNDNKVFDNFQTNAYMVLFYIFYHILVFRRVLTLKSLLGFLGFLLSCMLPIGLIFIWDVEILFWLFFTTYYVFFNFYLVFKK